MKILITGASCAGSTTLGEALGKHLNFPYFDTDRYFWEPADVPYTVKRNPVLRNKMLKDDLVQHENGIVSGSVISWGEDWKAMFDLVVFLYIPHETRMQRLHAREVERYGDAIFTDPLRIDLYHSFMDWAKGYDDNSTNGRNLQVQQNWLSQLNCKVLEIKGDTSVKERIHLILEDAVIKIG